MKNEFEGILRNLEERESLIIGDQTFLNETVLDEYLQCSLLGTRTFFEVDFKSVDFTGSTFVNCEFRNCQFKDVALRKYDFWNPTFENCIFLETTLRASHFSDFEFIETKFNNSDLDSIGSRSIKVRKLNQCTEIELSSNLGNFLENMS